MPGSPETAMANVKAFATWGPVLEIGVIAPAAQGVASTARLTWNEFQRLYARQGFSTTEKAAMYRIYKISGARPLARSEITSQVIVRSSKAEELAVAEEIYGTQVAGQTASSPLEAVQAAGRSGLFAKAWNKLKSWFGR